MRAEGKSKVAAYSYLSKMQGSTGVFLGAKLIDLLYIFFGVNKTEGLICVGRFQLTIVLGP